MKKIMIIHGPNLNFTGVREKNLYGSATLADINASIEVEAEKLGFNTEFFQSNVEGEIINCLQSCFLESFDAIIINPGALTYYSYAIRDAITSIGIVTVEVHIPNITVREDFHSKSVVTPVCAAQITGFGSYGYILALHGLKQRFL